MMLDDSKSREIAYRSARETLGERNVIRVLIEPTTDADGRDALRVTIVVPPDALDHIEDHALIQTLMTLNKNLREEGEERQPVVFYASEEELAAADGDPNP